MEKDSEYRRGRLEKLFEEIVNYKKNVQNIKSTKQIRNYVKKLTKENKKEGKRGEKNTQFGIIL